MSDPIYFSAFGSASSSSGAAGDAELDKRLKTAREEIWRMEDEQRKQKQREQEARRDSEKTHAFEAARQILKLLGGVAQFALIPEKDRPKEFTLWGNQGEPWRSMPDSFKYTGDVLGDADRSASSVFQRIYEDAMRLRRWTPEYRAFLESVVVILPPEDVSSGVRGAGVCLLYQLTGTPMPRARDEHQIHHC